MQHEDLTTLLAWCGDHWFLTMIALIQIGRFSRIFNFVTHETKIEKNNNVGKAS